MTTFILIKSRLTAGRIANARFCWMLGTWMLTMLIANAHVGWAQDANYELRKRPHASDARSSEKLSSARNAFIAELERCDILCVLAHPDDETFMTGTLSLLAEQGKSVQLVYATSGNTGRDATGRNLRGNALGKERENEVRAAVKVLGLSRDPLFLRYPGRQVFNFWDEVVANVQTIIEKATPEVVITFGPDGIYGHIDHVAIGQVVGRAFDESGKASYLLHMALSKSVNDRIAKLMGQSRYKPVADRIIDYRVDVGSQLDRRVAAMACHETQFIDTRVEQFRTLAARIGVEEFVEARRSAEGRGLPSPFTD